MLVKDISRFKNRSLARSVLIDPHPLNFILTPDNGYPMLPYTAEYATPEGGARDDYLMSVVDDIETMRKEKDVRAWLNRELMVRQILKNSKLI